MSAMTNIFWVHIIQSQIAIYSVIFRNLGLFPGNSVTRFGNFKYFSLIFNVFMFQKQTGHFSWIVLTQESSEIFLNFKLVEQIMNANYFYPSKLQKGALIF